MEMVNLEGTIVEFKKTSYVLSEEISIMLMAFNLLLVELFLLAYG